MESLKVELIIHPPFFFLMPKTPSSYLQQLIWTDGTARNCQEWEGIPEAQEHLKACQAQVSNGRWLDVAENVVFFSPRKPKCTHHCKVI